MVAPKNLLRHPDAKSGLWEFDDKADDKGILGVRFKRLIMDASAEDRCTYFSASWQTLGLYFTTLTMLDVIAQAHVSSPGLIAVVFAVVVVC